MADETNVPGVEAVQDGVHTVVEDFKTPRKHVWLLLVIGGGLVLLAYLIKRNAKTIAAATPTAAPASVAGASTILDTMTNPPASTTSTTGAPPPVPVPVHHIPPPAPPVTVGPPVHVGPPPPVAVPPPPRVGPPAPGRRTYTVVEGDTLGNIGARFHSNALALYALNAHTIDAMAKAHGAPPPYFNWIYPGETLYLS